MKLEKSVPVGKQRPEMKLRRVVRKWVQAVSEPPSPQGGEK